MLRWVSAGTWNTTTLVQGTRIFRFVPRFESHISMVSLEYKIIRRFMTSFLILILIARMLFLERGKWKPRLTFSGFQERLEIFSICLQILRMSLSMFHGGAEACGVVAGGGTEVTLLACLGMFSVFLQILSVHIIWGNYSPNQRLFSFRFTCFSCLLVFGNVWDITWLCSCSKIMERYCLWWAKCV